MGGMIAPVVGSGSWPAWTARVPKRGVSGDGFFIQLLVFRPFEYYVVGALFDVRKTHHNERVCRRGGRRRSLGNIRGTLPPVPPVGMSPTSETPHKVVDGSPGL